MFEGTLSVILSCTPHATWISQETRTVMRVFDEAAVADASEDIDGSH